MFSSMITSFPSEKVKRDRGNSMCKVMEAIKTEYVLVEGEGK